jgi:hypothetical protein
VLQFGAESGPGGGAFDEVTFRYDWDSNINQTYIWEHRAPASAVRVWNGTRRAHLVLDTNSTVTDMRFEARRPTHTRTFGCNTFLAPEASTVTWTIGRLKGNFSFTPRESMLEARATRVRALAEKIVPTGKRCRHHFPKRCYPQSTFGFWNIDTSVSTWEEPGSTFRLIDAIRFFGGSSNFEWQWIWGSPLHGNPVRRSADGITVNATNLGPFLSGKISFDHAVRLPTGRAFHCDVHRTGYAWSSGSLTMNLDPGANTVTGSRLHARSYVYRSPAA